ncbi:hypothetical protein BGX27_001543, partial [Mortierella sp. AM989]
VEVPLSIEEKQVYEHLWAAIEKSSSGFVTSDNAVRFFEKTGLSNRILGYIWIIADADNKGVLDQQSFFVALKLIAHAQDGKTPSLALIGEGPSLPHFKGISTDPFKISTQNIEPEPVLTRENRAKYKGMFDACEPVDGLIDGEKGRKIFLKSRLPIEKLTQIWHV